MTCRSDVIVFRVGRSTVVVEVNEEYRYISSDGRCTAARTYTCTNCLPPTMSDDKVAGDAAPRDGTVHSARMENVFVNFDAFAANFGSCFVNFVGILTLYDTRCKFPHYPIRFSPLAMFALLGARSEWEARISEQARKWQQN